MEYRLTKTNSFGILSLDINDAYNFLIVVFKSLNQSNCVKRNTNRLETLIDQYKITLTLQTRKVVVLLSCVKDERT